MRRHRRWALLCLSTTVALVAAACVPPAPGTGLRPNVVANAEPTTGAAPLTVVFSGEGSEDPDGEIVEYRWSVGDGSEPLLGEQVEHTYADPGTYEARLTVTDDDGNRRTSSPIEIEVVAATNLAPVAVAGAEPTSGRAPLEVQLSSEGSEDPDGEIVAFDWDLGDGSTSDDANPVHTYDAVGSYVATLTVTDDDGATGSDTVVIDVVANQAPSASASATPTAGRAPLSVEFSGSASSDPDGEIVAFAWDFGDGATSEEADPTHTYTEVGEYTATLTVTDDDGATDTAGVVIVVSANQAPTAVVNAVPSSGPAPLTVTFTGSESSDPDGEIVAYAWDFGDGLTSEEADPTHTYTEVGEYTATLTVTDDEGATDTATLVVVVEAEPNLPPEAVADATPTSGVAPLTVEFSGSASFDPDGEIVAFAWDFGDGVTSSEADPTHTFTGAGEYTATLTVTDDRGATATATVAVEVASNQSPTAVADATPTSGVAPLTVEFSGSGSSDPDGEIVAFAWDFGDGVTSSEADPTHTFTGAGEYTATLTVTDDRGLTDSASVVVVVTANVAPTAVANALPASGVVPPRGPVRRRVLGRPRRRDRDLRVGVR